MAPNTDLKCNTRNKGSLDGQNAICVDMHNGTCNLHDINVGLFNNTEIVQNL